MAPELGARDPVRLLPARGSFFLFGSSRKCDRIFGHSLLNAGQFTKSRKPSAIDAASPPVSFAQKTADVAPGSRLRPYGLHPSNMIWSAHREARFRSSSLRTVQVSSGSPNSPRANRGATAGRSLTE